MSGAHPCGTRFVTATEQSPACWSNTGFFGSLCSRVTRPVRTYIPAAPSTEPRLAYTYILVDIEAGVMNITLNRPDVLNSFHLAMAQELHQALDVARAEERQSVRCC